MVRDAGVQAVIICTPHPAHAMPTIQAVRAGAHVLVEKPLASSLQDCDAMIAAARKAGVKLGMISQRRLYAPVQRVKKAIDDGKIDMAGRRGRSLSQSSAASNRFIAMVHGTSR